MSLLEGFFILLFLGVSAFLSMSEIALVGISKVRLRHMVDRGNKRAAIAQKMVAQLDEVITTILVGSNFINAALTSLVTAACILWLGEGLGVLVSSILAGTLVLLFTDILPKVYAAGHAERVSLQVAPVMSLVVGLFRPVSRSMTQMTHAALKSLGVQISVRSPLVTEEELKVMIELGKEEGVLGEHERRMLHRIFEFGDLGVKDVMIPRDQMVSVSQRASHEEVLTILTEQGHSRIPVYGDSPDQMVGILYAQELLHIWREGWLIILQDLIHPAFKVSPQMKVLELLQEFQKRHLQIAIVEGLEGKTLGLVTLEDLLEEIVGDIREAPPLPQ